MRLRSLIAGALLWAAPAWATVADLNSAYSLSTFSETELTDLDVATTVASTADSARLVVFTATLNNANNRTGQVTLVIHRDDVQVATKTINIEAGNNTVQLILEDTGLSVGSRNYEAFVSGTILPLSFTTATTLEVVGYTAVAGVGVDTFVELTDTPASYSGAGSKLVAVNSGATALEFITDSKIDGSGTANRLARFTDSNTVGNSLLSDDATNVTMTSGQVLVTAGAAATPAIADKDQTSTGWVWAATGIGHWSDTGILVMSVGNDVVKQRSTGIWSWAPGSDITAVGDTNIARAAAGHAVVRNSTNAQSFSVSETYTDDSNFERGSIVMGSDTMTIGPVTAGTGSDNMGISLVTAGTGVVGLAGNATQAAQLRIAEDTDDGSNYSSFTVPALAGNVAYTLPPDDGDSGEQLQTNGSGVLTWEAAGGSSLPAVDTTSVVEGSADNTKEIRFEVDGLTTGTVRVLTPQDADYTLAGTTVALGGTGLTSGTSGGILGFTASGTLASSAALTDNNVVLGGGAGATPTSSANFTFDDTNFRLRGQNLTTATDNATNMLQFSGTLPTSPSTTAQAFSFIATSAGSASQSQQAAIVTLAAGYTGSSVTLALNSSNTAVGTGNTLNLGSTTDAVGNYGQFSSTSGVGAGLNIGVNGKGTGSTSTNIGVSGKAVNTAAGTMIGVLGNAASSTEGTDLKNVGGYFTLDNTLITGANVSVALLAQGDGTDDIFRGYDDTTLIFRMEDTGEFTSAGTASLGWSAVAGANTACTTTCTNAAVAGYDAGTNALVGPADATADTCICAGAS